jgi:hypothetical protein
MQESQIPEHMEESNFNVGDSQIWAEIFYLDSPTAYRECLQQDAGLSSADKLTMLEDPSSTAALTPETLIRLLVISIRAICGQSSRISAIVRSILD